MKPVHFVPEGRKLTEFVWHADSCAQDPDTKNVTGPRATVVVRFVEKDAAFNGRVEGTTVYAEGDGVKAVRDECFAQLDALHAVVWSEWLWVRFTADNLYVGIETPFQAIRVRTATTPHGPVWQRWGKSDRHEARGEARWLTTLLGRPPTGVVSGEKYGQSYTAILCDPSDAIAAAVADLAARWTDTLKRARDLFQFTFESAGGLPALLRQKGELVPHVLAEAAKLPPREASDAG